MSQVLYADPIALRNATGPQELAQVATPDTASAIVTAADMNACIVSNGSSGTTDAQTAYKKIVDALNRASAMIDTKLRAVYTLPLTFTPPVLTEFAVDIARFYLHRNGVTDLIKYRYEDAMKQLNGVASGITDLGAVGTNNTGILTAGLGIAYCAPTRDNTYDTLAPFACVGNF